MDYIIIMCFIVTIIYCWKMDKKVSLLKNSKAEMLKLINNFDDSIVRSEISIHELKQLGTNTTGDLQRRIDKANHLVQDLSFLTDRANEISNRLEMVTVKSAHTVKALNVQRPQLIAKKEPQIFHSNSNVAPNNFEQMERKAEQKPNIDVLLQRISEIREKSELRRFEANDEQTYKPKIVRQSEYFNSLKRINS